MQEEIYEDTKQRMQKTIDAFKSNLTKIRTGRASPDILDSITVDYYAVSYTHLTLPTNPYE